MKAHAYCYARCNRAKRRLCKKDCQSDVVESPIERSLLDIETYYLAALKLPSALPSLYDYQIYEELMKNEEFRRGCDAMKLWLVALGPDSEHMAVPPSWRVDGIVPLYWDPRSLFKNWKDDVKWFNESKDEAIAGGLDSMLEAYYSGVPVEDILA